MSIKKFGVLAAPGPEALQLEMGMEEAGQQDFDSAAEYYRPDFGHAKLPFKDIEDFTSP